MLRAMMPNLHEISVRFFSRYRQRDFERHLAHGEPIVVAAGILSEQRFEFFNFLHEELGNCFALRKRLGLHFFW